MQFTDLTLRLLLLFFPGIICAYIVDAYTVHRPRTPFFFVLQSFVYGFLAYLAYWSALKLWLLACPCSSYHPMIFLRALTDSSVKVSYREIVQVCAVAVTLGLTITALSTYKVHIWLGHKLNLTKKFGELDVWGYTFNSKEIEWATVRDTDADLVYDGWVKAFSDDSQNAELLLRDVAVYKNSTGEPLYKTGAMYLSLDRQRIAIEFRDFEVTNNDEFNQEIQQWRQRNDRERVGQTNNQ